MPGLVLELEGTRIVGYAWHPRYRRYEVLVHALLGPAIVRSVLAKELIEHERLPEDRTEHGFIIDLGPFGITPERMARVKLLIGETDEWLELPDRGCAGAEITVEEILAASFPRPWVTGNIHFDAQLAGFSTETIVDLLYRDYLGRPADPEGLFNYSARIESGLLSYSEFRRILVSSQEYVLRRWRAYEAPGAIFSQQIVMRAGKELDPARKAKAGQEVQISLRELAALGGIDFVLQAYQQLLGRPADSRAVWRHLSELRAGRHKLDIIWEISRQPAAPGHNIRFLHAADEPETPVAPPAQPARARQSRQTAASFPVGDLRGNGSVATVGRRTLTAAPARLQLTELLRFDGEQFMTAAFRRLLGREPSAGEAAFCMGELAFGDEKKQEIAAFLAGEPEAITRNVVLVDHPDLVPQPVGEARPDDVVSARLDPMPTFAGAQDDVVSFGRSAKEASELLLFGRTAAPDDADGISRGVPDAGSRKADPASAVIGLEDAMPEADGDGVFSGTAAEVEELFVGGLADPVATSTPDINGAAYRPFGDPNSLEGPLVGKGFYPAETDGRNWWRWTGPGGLAQIRLPVARPGSYRIAIWCERAPPTLLDGLAVQCRGNKTVALVTAVNGSASIICEALAPENGFIGWLDIELCYPPPERSADGRVLGLCIGSIKVE
jgi:hypothetical protein